MPREIRRLADDLLRDPHVVELADAAPAATIDHALFLVPEKRKRDLLEHLLRGDDCDSAIVFTADQAPGQAPGPAARRRRATAPWASRATCRRSQRDRAMRGFRSRRYDVLVATDIAARGIDVSDVSHVINFDVPNTPEAYTHRIGRTGRAEREGIACTFVTQRPRLGAGHRTDDRRRIERRQVEGFEAEPEPGNGQGRGAYPVHAKGGFGGRSRGTRPYGQRPQGEGRGGGRRDSGRSRRQRQR